MKRIIALSLLALAFLYGCQKDDDNGLSPYRMDGGGWEKPSGEQYEDYGENPFLNVEDEPQSTFAIDADGGSYSNTRRFLNLGQMPPTASVRVEEYINYFTFDYPDPSGEAVSINSEVASCPWTDGHKLMRIGLKGENLDTQERLPANMVLLIDVSGSMSTPEKLELLKSGFKTFVDQIGPADRIAIVTYAGQAGVKLPSTHGDEKNKIKQAIDELGSGGSTAGAEGIITAYEIAEENFIPGGNNRVILGSDGDFNVGPSSTEELVELIEEKHESGIYLTVLGVGSGNLNDAMMEQLANNGNGNYEYIDNVEQMRKVFIYEYDKFFTVAKDCRIQVSFDENTVDAYRLIGYENRVMDNEDFDNDSTDAGEIGAGQTITALYEIVPKEASVQQGHFAKIQFRYKYPDQSNSRLMEHELNHQIQPFENASENMRFAASVAAFGMITKESEYKGNATLDKVSTWAENAVSYDPHGFRDEFLSLVRTAGSID
ncbi:MAG: VWA domain-containing protein [Bacteroidales bacterium]|nr:VWA domain-containing protein [Bacteroidales bacterium]